MKKGLYILVPLAIIAALLFRLKANKETAQSRIYRYDKGKAIPVKAETLSYKQTETTNTYTGTFEPHRESKISAEMPGRITAIYVDAGSQVKKGEPLLQLDNALLKLQLQAVDVQIQGLQADVNRFTILMKADAVEGVQLEKAAIGLKSAQVQRKTLLEQIKKSRITAPFNGIVTAKLVEVGGFAAPGLPLIQLTDIAQLKFTVYVPEKDLSSFRENKYYPLISDAYPEVPLQGKTILIGSKANTGNSFPVQLEVKNTENKKIKSGMFGKVLLQDDEPRKNIIIPATAIVGSTVKPQVYLIKNGKAVLQDITVSKRINNEAVVQSGLRAGDVMATSGFINLYEGALVQVK
ncbi:MAG: efflux RND transporter periplasmic adaptor subunit [Adhaeribacter sp.]